MHGAQEWIGWRACIAAYVDTRTLQFFESYELVEPAMRPWNNLRTVDGRQDFMFREMEVAEKNWAAYDRFTAAV